MKNTVIIAAIRLVLIEMHMADFSSRLVMARFPFF